MTLISPHVVTRATVVRAGPDTTLVSLPEWYSGQILAPVATWIIVMATNLSRGTLPGVDLVVNARLDALVDADLALQDWRLADETGPWALAGALHSGRACRP